MGGIKKIIAGILLSACIGCTSSQNIDDNLTMRISGESVRFNQADWERRYKQNDNARAYMLKNMYYMLSKKAGLALELYEDTDTNKDGVISLIEAMQKYDKLLDEVIR